MSVLVPQAIAEFQEEGAAAGFDIHIATLMPACVLADAGGLRRAMRNLLENAVKYSGTARDIQVSVRTGDRQVLISVQDSGIGIPQEDLTRIFRKFERGTEARASSIAGTGLGLALVSSIMHAHG